MFEIGLSDTDLVVGEEGIRIGDEFFAFDRITDLDFWVEGYDGMLGLKFRGYRSLRNVGKLSGADNKIHFRVNGRRYLYQFYLPDRNSMNRLGLVFKMFYERQIPFGECNRGGRTFLFQQVRSKKDLEQMKRNEGLA